MTSRLGTLFTRARDIYREEGLLPLIKIIFAFILSPVVDEYNNFYIYERPLKEGEEADHLHKIKNVTNKVVETVEQLEELTSEGFELSSLDISLAHYRLSKGAIAFLTFVDSELAYSSWAAFTKEAKKTVNRYPYKVDFKNHEITGGELWTNPKYRRQGLAYYSSYIREQFLISRGATRNRFIVLADNEAAQMGAAKGGAKLLAKARYLRIFGLQFWREKPVKSVNKAVTIHE